MKKVVALLISVLFLVSFFAGADVKTARAEGGAVYAEIDAYLERSAQNAHIPAMTVCMVDGENVLFSETYGEGADADTPYLLGSVSKSFTALSIMQLVEAGEVELDAPISQYLPNATDGDHVTVRQLLNHTSGLGEHQTLTNFHIVSGQGKHVYANVNYSLLGEIIEAVSGEPYAQYVQSHIFDALGMTHSAATREGSEKNGLIQGHRNYFGLSVPSAPFYPESQSDWIQPSAGYLSSSVSDLGKYLQMYLSGGGDVISEESIQTMFYEGVGVEGEIPYLYGMGWTLINEPLTEPAIRHSGLVETGMACLYLLPERGIGIAVLVNTNDYFVTNDMMDRIGWSIPLMLMGMGTNEIGGSEYVLRHLMFDAIYLVVFVAAVLPQCFMKRFTKPLSGKRLAVRIVFIALLHFVLPALLLALPQLFFATPLWVAQAFVPDLFLAILTSSVVLFAGGLGKTVLTIIVNKRKKEI